MLARELGESSGATSYHLRALAAAGLIVEDLDRRKGRERWWKREPQPVGLISSAPAEDPEYDAAVAQLESTMLERDEDAIRRYIHARGEGEHSDAWRESAFIGGWTVYATREEVDELSEHVVPLAAGAPQAGGGAGAGHAARLRHLPRAAADADRRVLATGLNSRARRPMTPARERPCGLATLPGEDLEIQALRSLCPVLPRCAAFRFGDCGTSPLHLARAGSG